ncbi:MAG TPA: hypothetical protein VN726_22830 [Hanamia sp.]|nr:hypothetical protein [Hanamia sp.]
MEDVQNEPEVAEIEPTEITSKLSDEEIAAYDEHAKELARKYNVSKVHVYIGIDKSTNERIVGFLKEPNYLQKVFALDKIATVGMFAAGDELREALTLKEESDPRTYSTSQDCDCYRLGMTGTCVPIIEVINNSFKKK